MKKQYATVLVTYLAAFLLTLNGKAQGNAPLKLVQEIPMPGVHGRMDHMTVDVKDNRLFVPANGDIQNTVEVIDLKSGKWISSIPGQSKPQGTFYSMEFNTLFVTNGTDGTCKIFRGDTFKLIDSLPLGTDANQVGYDADTKYLYAGLGDSNSGALAIIDTSSNKHIGDIKTDARPAGSRSRSRGHGFWSTSTGLSISGYLTARSAHSCNLACCRR